MTYLFTSQRLGFRNWVEGDIAPMAAINADADVMRFFPTTKTYDETTAFVHRMQQQMADKGYCYFAVDRLEDGMFVGFIGLSEQTFEASFTPCVDIGWRLHNEAWGKGYATEGAARCLQYAFGELAMDKVVAMAPAVNVPSVRVMEKIGMKKITDFVHPLLLDAARLRDCLLYEVSA